MPQHTHQMTFAQIGTLYNTMANELQGGVTAQNQDLLISQVTTIQTQLQGLIDSGALNKIDGVGNPADSLVHAQNVADQMSFLVQEIKAYGSDAFAPKFINDVVRDVQDIVAGDPQLSALAHQNNSSGFQQVSFLLTNPTPFPDSGAQTATLLQFVSDSQSLAARAQALAGADPNSADVIQLENDIATFSKNADTYTNAPEQAGLFAARFVNEFATHGVQGTASAELIKGLQTGNADLVNGAADVLIANSNDVRSNMLAQGDTFTPAPNGGIPDNIDTVNVAGTVFDDAVTKLLGGVYSGNQQSIVNDLNATATGLQNAITNEGITGHALTDINHVISLLGQETTLVQGINTASPTPVSDVNAEIGHIQAQILNIINHDATLATLAQGPGTADAAGNVTFNPGFVALPPGTHGHTAGFGGGGDGAHGGCAAGGQGGDNGHAGNTGHGGGDADAPQPPVVVVDHHFHWH
jgi:hypothetical protein